MNLEKENSALKGELSRFKQDNQTAGLPSLLSFLLQFRLQVNHVASWAP